MVSVVFTVMSFIGEGWMARTVVRTEARTVVRTEGWGCERPERGGTDR
ncbi:hypothetical protein DSM26151_00160 [Agromyces marinus]|uniref:Uncharacterized protein n=1 Tax=Agromyces marinus TaxID=1389020 RepID=A0ABN6YBM1_9MICO|nr:hypothetical protein DSM26151_00160 [Agromyces marinus]BDZ54754.1 hypothetical protein GCM10025870_18270 [Agromyces marinus]